jgi:hypothetical protein
MLAYLLAIICIAAAAMYYWTPSGQLPSFMLPSFLPGHDAAATAIHHKHAYAAAVVAVVLFLIGWFMGRSQRTA